MIAHDMREINPIRAQLFFELWSHFSSLPVALNIKADGLQDEIQRFILDSQFKNYFVFDASIPDLLGYKKRGINFYTRLSEYETQSSLFNQAQGVWLDQFHSTWFDLFKIKDLVGEHKNVCIVSPELHARDPKMLWSQLRSFIFESEIGSYFTLQLCTDLPQEAKEFFHE